MRTNKTNLEFELPSTKPPLLATATKSQNFLDVSRCKKVRQLLHEYHLFPFWNKRSYDWQELQRVFLSKLCFNKTFFFACHVLEKPWPALPDLQMTVAVTVIAPVTVTTPGRPPNDRAVTVIAPVTTPGMAPGHSCMAAFRRFEYIYLLISVSAIVRRINEFMNRLPTLASLLWTYRFKLT